MRFPLVWFFSGSSLQSGGKPKFVSITKRRALAIWSSSVSLSLFPSPSQSSYLNYRQFPQYPKLLDGLYCFVENLPLPCDLFPEGYWALTPCKDALLMEEMTCPRRGINCFLFYTPEHLTQTLFLYDTQCTAVICSHGPLLHSEARLGLEF